MTSLPRALGLAFAQLGDPAILKVLARTAAITLAIFAAAGALLATFLPPYLERWTGADGGLFAVLTILLAIIAAWFLFRIVALAVLQFFADDVVAAVEARHYPQARHTLRNVPWREELATSARSTTRALLVNLAVLPVALVLLFTGVGTALLFWFVNALLLGRELTEMVWLRHRAEPADAIPVPRVTRFLLGGAVAALLAIPFVNLLAPVLGAAAATHLVHGRRR